IAVQAKPEQTLLAPALKPAVPLTVTPEPKPAPACAVTVTWSPYAKECRPLEITWFPPAKVKSFMFASSQDVLPAPTGARPNRTEPRQGCHSKRVPAPVAGSCAAQPVPVDTSRAKPYATKAPELSTRKRSLGTAPEVSCSRMFDCAAA